MKNDAPIIGELFPGLPPETVPQPVKPHCTKANYRQSCQQRWGRIALRDALDNWEDFEELRETRACWPRHTEVPGLRDAEEDPWAGRPCHDAPAA